MKTQKTNIITGIVLALAVLMLSISMISALTVESVTSNPSEVAPGETASIKIELENNLDQDVTNINIALDLTAETPIAPYQSSAEKFIDEINDDDSESVSFKIQVLPDAKAGVYKIPYSINYEFDGEVFEKTGIISLTVNEKPELEIISDENVVIKGRVNDFTIRIINSGLTDVKLLSIEVMNSGNINVISEKKIYIGSLNSDDFDTADFKISVPINSGNLLNLPVKLTYRDITNNELTEKKNVGFRAYTTEEARKMGLIPTPSYTAYIIIILIIVFFIGYRTIKGVKKRRRKKKARQEAEL